MRKQIFLFSLGKYETHTPKKKNEERAEKSNPHLLK